MNKPHIEKEYKMLIDKEMYCQLMKEYDCNSFVQVNHYYDTFHKTNAMRIREVKGKYIFTLKIKDHDVKKEYEFEIENNSMENEKIKEVLEKFRVEKYQYIGDMKTTRSTMDLEYGQLCIDKSEYNGHVDYELEYELYDASNDHFEEFDAFLKKHKLVYMPSYKTKFGRFKESLG